MKMFSYFRTNKQLTKELEATKKQLADAKLETANCKAELIVIRGRLLQSDRASDVIGGIVIRAISPILPDAIRKVLET